MAIKIGVSSCLLGQRCNYDGKDLLSTFVEKLSRNPEVEFVRFCPEHSVFGTPRPNLRIVGGDGLDVLSGKAQVIDEHGKDVTTSQIEGAQQFLDKLKSQNVNFAILMEGSPSCGSNILLSEENWPQGGFKRGVGVSAALLQQNGIRTLGCFDQLSISEFLKSVLENFEVHAGLKDLKDMPKFQKLFES